MVAGRFRASRPTPRASLGLGIAVWLLTATPLFAQVPLPEMGALQGSGISVLSQSVSVSVASINIVAVSASSVSLSLSTGMEATDNSTTYDITVNGSSKKLTGSLNADYSNGISLDIELAPPTGASAQLRTLTTSAQDLVTGISYTAESNLVITYTGRAQPSTSPNGAGETRTVTITVTDS